MSCVQNTCAAAFQLGKHLSPIQFTKNLYCTQKCYSPYGARLIEPLKIDHQLLCDAFNQKTLKNISKLALGVICYVPALALAGVGLCINFIEMARNNRKEIRTLNRDFAEIKEEFKKPPLKSPFEPKPMILFNREQKKSFHMNSDGDTDQKVDQIQKEIKENCWKWTGEGRLMFHQLEIRNVGEKREASLYLYSTGK